MKIWVKRLWQWPAELWRPGILRSADCTDVSVHLIGLIFKDQKDGTVKSQKGAYLIYTAAEAWNLVEFFLE